MNAQRVEGFALVLIIVVVGVAAGAASFTHVHDWTMTHSPAGTPGWFGWANACISELVPVAALLDIRRRRRTRKPLAYPMCLLVAGICLSLSAQLAVAKPSPSGWLLSAVPALAFMALTKLVFSRTPPTHAAGTPQPRSSPAVTQTTPIAERVMPAIDQPPATDHTTVPMCHPSGHVSHVGTSAPDYGDAVSPETTSEGLGGTAPFHPNPPAAAPGNGAASLKQQPDADVSTNGAREAARRLYEASVRNGRPLSTRDLARTAGCSPTTA